MDAYVRIVGIFEEEQHVQHQGRVMLRGRSLAPLVRELGGYEGELREYLCGQPHRISLFASQDRDPATTWLDIHFITEKA